METKLHEIFGLVDIGNELFLVDCGFSVKQTETRLARLDLKAAARGSLVGRVIDAHAPLQIGEVTVQPVVVPHDAREPVQFVFQRDSARVGVLSDLGHITAHVVEQYQQLDLLLMESNHDREMLQRGRYPHSVKQRILGDHGHLSNEQAAAFLSQIGHGALKVVVGHVSEENNHPDLLQQTFAGFHNMVGHLGFATQAEGASWLVSDLFGVPQAEAASAR